MVVFESVYLAAGDGGDNNLSGASKRLFIGKLSSYSTAESLKCYLYSFLVQRGHPNPTSSISDAGSIGPSGPRASASPSFLVPREKGLALGSSALRAVGRRDQRRGERCAADRLHLCLGWRRL